MNVTFLLSLNINAKLRFEIYDEVNGGIDIEVGYSSYMMVLVLNARM